MQPLYRQSQQLVPPLPSRFSTLLTPQNKNNTCYCINWHRLLIFPNNIRAESSFQARLADLKTQLTIYSRKAFRCNAKQIPLRWKSSSNWIHATAPIQNRRTWRSVRQGAAPTPGGMPRSSLRFENELWLCPAVSLLLLFAATSHGCPELRNFFNCWNSLRISSVFSG